MQTVEKIFRKLIVIKILHFDEDKSLMFQFTGIAMTSLNTLGKIFMWV